MTERLNNHEKKLPTIPRAVDVMEDINHIEHQLFSPEKISSKALRYLLGELAVMESMSEPERIEAAIARIEYQLRLREGQGY